MAKQETLTPIQRLIVQLGGISRVAKELGHNNHTTVQAWFAKGTVPKWRRAELAFLASQHKKPIPQELRS